MDVGLRERKRRATRNALSTAARELVLERGLEQVTVEDIAAAAGVSVRTFSNYFRRKDEAIVGVEPAMLAELAAELRDRPADEDPVTALRAVLLADADTNADAMLRRSELRSELVDKYPELLPRYLESMVQIEGALADALAVRMGVDPASDPAPRVLVASTLAVLRTTIAWWREHRDSVGLPELLVRTFDRYAVQMPASR